MTQQELVARLSELAEETVIDHAPIAACLHGLASAVVAGGDWPRLHMEATCSVVRKAMLELETLRQTPS